MIAALTPTSDDGPKMLLGFIHGYLDAATAWQPVIDRLPADDVAVAVDLSPAADNSTPAHTLESYADQVIEAVQRFQGRRGLPVVVVGHSMGGPIAELAAVRLGAALAGLVLVVPAPLAGYPLSADQRSAWEARTAGRDAESARAGKCALDRHLSQKALDILVAATMSTDPRFAIEQLRAWVGGHPAGRERSKVEAPVLVLTSDDTFFSHDFLSEQARRFSDVRIVRIEGAGHWVHLERPDETTACIVKFIATLRAR